jgi:Uma2 family endonuclease
MGVQSKTLYTYDDLQGFPEDNRRREIIDGDLIVTAAPSTRHQRAVAWLVVQLYHYAEEHGGAVYPAPTDVYFSRDNVVEPDVVFLREENLVRVEKTLIRSAPDVVVEVSSPSTRRLEVVRKLELYERYGVPEYWYVDLDADRIEAYTLEGGRYGPPRVLVRGDSLDSTKMPGLTLRVDGLLGSPEED